MLEEIGKYLGDEDYDVCKNFKCRKCKTICHEDDERGEGDSICLTCNLKMIAAK
jgi:hypothetical protein